MKFETKQNTSSLNTIAQCASITVLTFAYQCEKMGLKLKVLDM